MFGPQVPQSTITEIQSTSVSNRPFVFGTTGQQSTISPVTTSTSSSRAFVFGPAVTSQVKRKILLFF